MALATIYPGANTSAQWFANAYPGVIMPTTDILVLHTTETGDWPDYAGGASAPTMTIKVDVPNKKLLVREHFPLNMSARALKHPSGTPATNTAGVIQIEMIGTCDKSFADKYGYFYWPSAPVWVKDQLAGIIATLNKIRGIPLKAIKTWLAYPSSSGNSPARMSNAQWASFSGVCGHEHVPNNDHGDPGNIDIVYIMNKAAQIAAGGDSMSAQDVADLKAYIDSKIDDHAAAVWGYLIGSAWDGRAVPAGAMLSSAQRYAIEGGWSGLRPDGNGRPGTPTFAGGVASELDAAATATQVSALRAALDAAPKPEVSQAEFDAISAKVDAILAKLDALAAPK